MILLLIVALIFAFIVLKDKLWPVTQAAILIVNNVYGTLVLVLLLSYGLAFIPHTLWKSVANQDILVDRLYEAERIFNACKDAKHEFTKEVNICRNLVDSHGTE